MKNKENNRVIAAAGVVGKQISLIIIAVIIATLFLAVSDYEPFAIVNGLIRAMTKDIAGTIRCLISAWTDSCIWERRQRQQWRSIFRLP